MIVYTEMLNMTHYYGFHYLKDVKTEHFLEKGVDTVT